MDFSQYFRKAIKPYYSRIMMSIGRGILTLADDSKNMQVNQITLQKNEVREGLERFQNYGFTSLPHEGAEAAVVFVGGNRDHGMVIAVDDRRYRLKSLQSGEVALYTDEGDSIVLKRDNNIEINTATLTINAQESVVNSDQVTVNSEETTINASSKVSFNTPILECSGDIVDNAGSNSVSMSGMRVTYNDHDHEENPAISGTTDKPNQLME